MRWIWLALKMALALVLLAVEAVFWLGHGIGQMFRLTSDVIASRKSLSAGRLHCPAGHVIETEEQIYRCEKCGFNYKGSRFICGNPECKATTPFLTCDCGLSIRSPYRWG
jgi:hypothetical protein